MGRNQKVALLPCRRPIMWRSGNGTWEARQATPLIHRREVLVGVKRDGFPARWGRDVTRVVSAVELQLSSNVEKSIDMYRTESCKSHEAGDARRG